MESSFFDDLLKKDVDQNAVNALAGSLQSHVTSTNNSGSKLATVAAFSSGNLVKDGPKASQTGLSTARGGESATIIYSNVTGTAPINGSMSSVPLSNSIASSISNNNDSKSFSNTASSAPNRQEASTGIASQVNIAPKNMVTNTVPIAPRMPTTIMITPQQAQVLMAQRFGAGTTIVPSNILSNVRMTGGQVPLVPRLTGPNNVTAMSGINMMAGQIQGVQNLVPRLTLTQNQIIASLANQNTQSPPIGIVQTIKQESNTSGLTVATQVASSNPGQSAGTVLPAATLTQVKGSSPVPGVVTYRFRQVTPTTIATTNANNVAVMKESVKKLKEFFQNLISLASGSNQPPEIGRSVRELVQNVMVSTTKWDELGQGG